MNSNSRFLYLFIAWLISCVATGGSLFFSEVMEFAPCSLCWYQRLFMYPLSLIFLIGIIRDDKSVLNYAIPFNLIGLGISIFHNLIQMDIIPETASPCREGISCAGKWIEWAGFITIPVLSFIAFSLILIFSILYKRGLTNEK